jgi:uncharacterized membrane protein
MKQASIRAFTNRLIIRIGVIALAVGVLVLIIVSPIAQRQFTRLRGMNWMLLSNVGQTYGAVSALFAALALGGVVVSLLYQAGAVRTAREQAARTFHHELLKMAMENPLYMEVLSYPPGDYREKADYDSLRQYDYVHMWVSYWEGLYDLRDMQEDYLRFIAANELFNGIVGRQYWSAVGRSHLEIGRGRRRRFAQILDEEYQKAIAGGPRGLSC